MGTTPNAMPLLPRLGSAGAVVGWANALVNAIEIQMRRLIAPQTPADTPAVSQHATTAGFQITAQLTIFTAVDAGATATVPGTPGWGLVVNGGVNALTLGPQPGGTINGGASVSIAPGAQKVWAVNSATVAFAN